MVAQASRFTLKPLLFVPIALFLAFDLPAFADSANVFVYHRFNDSRYPSTNINSSEFIAHLELLRKERFVVLSLGQVVSALQSGQELPQKCAVITIDDGYHSFLSDGWPILKKYGFPATLFVSSGSVGGGDFLSWKDLRQLMDEGVEIGNHSAQHDYFLGRSDGDVSEDESAEVLDDLTRSQAAFNRHLGFTPELFAYPYGEFSLGLAAIVKAAGFKAAFGQQSGVVSSEQNLFVLPRFPVGGGYTDPANFYTKLYMKPLHVDVVTPKSPLILDDNPPTLRFYLKDKQVDVKTLKCFVPGQAGCQVVMVSECERLFEVVAAQPINGRRSKYTVTATDVLSKQWYWYSQLWVRPGVGMVADEPVSR